MAAVRKQVSKSGKITTYRVEWREGGRRGGKRDSETCDDKTIAEDFAARVRLAGHRRPEGYPKGCRGRALLVALVDAADDEATEADSVPTLAEVVDQYLGKLKRAEERQVAQYGRLFDQHVRHAIVTLPDGGQVGPLGGLPIDQFTTEVDEAWVEWMQARRWVYRKAKTLPDGTRVKADVRSYSAKTIRNIHGSVMSPAMAFAARKYGKHVPVNPCAGVELPEVNGRSVNLDYVPTGDEIEQWIEIGYEVSELAGDIITIATGTGLRWGELTALRPCDVDLKRDLLHVRQVVKEDAKRRPYIASYGKSDAALRTIRIGRKVRKVLKRRIKGLDLKSLIFRARHGGIYRSTGWHQTHWSKVVAKAVERGIMTQVTPHKLRHAHATTLLAMNVSLDTVSKRLGHKSIVTTSALYSHLEPEADERAANAIDDVMSGKRKKSKNKKGKKPRAAEGEIAA
ncbi:site-specific integrase [Actinomadura fulvescens]|uniref:Tyr recombinase domain-containing protein n=1 Tax=Actinomadura fulvescens TaxID=46160 RepID=A0ABP6CGW3_9ACTN